MIVEALNIYFWFLDRDQPHEACAIVFAILLAS
jgi:hypothetical protein